MEARMGWLDNKVGGGIGDIPGIIYNKGQKQFILHAVPNVIMLNQMVRCESRSLKSEGAIPDGT